MTQDNPFKYPMKVLDFFSLLSDDGRLSITNIAVIILLAKIASAPINWQVVAGLFVTLLGYAHKRSVNAATAITAVDPTLAQAQSEIEAKINTVATSAAKVASAVQTLTNKE